MTVWDSPTFALSSFLFARLNSKLLKTSRRILPEKSFLSHRVCPCHDLVVLHFSGFLVNFLLAQITLPVKVVVKLKTLYRILHRILQSLYESYKHCLFIISLH